MSACHRTSDRQEDKIIWRAGPERDMIFHLRVRVTACRELGTIESIDLAESMQGSHCRDERLAWVASRWQGTSCSSSVVSKVLGANCKRADNFHPVANKFAM